MRIVKKLSTLYRKISVETLLFLGFCLGFVVLKIINLVPRVSDENLYFYTANLLSKGFIPYRDFFHQVLPGQILLYAVVIKLFGFNLTLLKLFPLFFSLGSAFLLFKMVDGKQGQRFGVVASALFLFSFVTLPSTDFGNGPHGAIFFLLLSWYFFDRSEKLAGLAFFFGLIYRIYILPAEMGLIIRRLWKQEYRKTSLFLLWSLLPFVALNLMLFWMYGEQFLTPVWRYHFLKSAVGLKQSVFSDLYKSDLVLILFALAGTYTLFSLLRKKKGVSKDINVAKFIELGIAAALALVLQYTFFYSLSNVFLFYLIVLVPFLSILAALALTVIVPARSRRAALLLVLALSLLNSFFYQKSIARMTAINNLENIVAEVETITEEGDPIYGAYTIAPLIALRTKMQVIDNEVDTNVQRYTAGLLSSDQGTRLATESALFIQLASVNKETNEILGAQPHFVKFKDIRKYCSLFRNYPHYNDFRFNSILVWDCRGGGIKE